MALAGVAGMNGEILIDPMINPHVGGSVTAPNYADHCQGLRSGCNRHLEG